MHKFLLSYAFNDQSTYYMAPVAAYFITTVFVLVQQSALLILIAYFLCCIITFSRYLETQRSFMIVYQIGPVRGQDVVRTQFEFMLRIALSYAGLFFSAYLIVGYLMNEFTSFEDISILISLFCAIFWLISLLGLIEFHFEDVKTRNLIQFIAYIACPICAIQGQVILEDLFQLLPWHLESFLIMPLTVFLLWLSFKKSIKLYDQLDI